MRHDRLRFLNRNRQYRNYRNLIEHLAFHGNALLAARLRRHRRTPSGCRRCRCRSLRTSVLRFRLLSVFHLWPTQRDAISSAAVHTTTYHPRLSPRAGVLHATRYAANRFCLCALPPRPGSAWRPVLERGAHFGFHAEPSRCPARQTLESQGASDVRPASVFNGQRFHDLRLHGAGHALAGVALNVIVAVVSLRQTEA